MLHFVCVPFFYSVMTAGNFTGEVQQSNPLDYMSAGGLKDILGGGSVLDAEGGGGHLVDDKDGGKGKEAGKATGWGRGKGSGVTVAILISFGM